MIKLGINPDGTPFARLPNGELHTIQGWIDATEDFSDNPKMLRLEVICYDEHGQAVTIDRSST